VQGHRGALAVATVLTLLGSAAGLAQPLAAKAVVDALGQGRTLVEPLIVLGALVVVGAAVNGFGSWMVGRTAERVVLGVRRGLAGRLLRLRIAELDARAPGDLVSRATADSTLLRSAATDGLIQLITGSLGLVGAIVLMAVLNGTLLLVTLAVLAVVAAVILVVLPRIRAAVTSAQEAVGGLGAALDRALGAARTVKASGAEAKETVRVGVAAEQSYRAGLTQARYTALIGVLSELSLQVSFLVVLGIGGGLVATGAMPVSTLVAFLLYLFYLSGPIAALTLAATQLQEGLGAAARIREVDTMATESDVDITEDRPLGTPLPGACATHRRRVRRLRLPGPGPGAAGVSFTAPAGGGPRSWDCSARARPRCSRC